MRMIKLTQVDFRGDKENKKGHIFIDSDQICLIVEGKNESSGLIYTVIWSHGGRFQTDVIETPLEIFQSKVVEFT